jgi:hypothetical protein
MYGAQLTNAGIFLVWVVVLLVLVPLAVYLGRKLWRAWWVYYAALNKGED